MSREEFQTAVLKALPDQMLDAESNFTNATAYDPGNSYRLVMVFHAEDETLTDEVLCQRAVERPDKVDAETEDAPFQDIMSTTRVTAAFCENNEALSTATDKMVGKIEPGQASFRFLVADVTKQLFPDGFAELPSASALAGGGAQ